jgi:hypothetical protein
VDLRVRLRLEENTHNRVHIHSFCSRVVQLQDLLECVAPIRFPHQRSLVALPMYAGNPEVPRRVETPRYVKVNIWIGGSTTQQLPPKQR